MSHISISTAAALMFLAFCGIAILVTQ